jgi:hypothetical protein
VDFTSEYCPERRRLEQRSWNLVSKLSTLTEQLMMLIGKDHTEFIATKAMCVSVRREVLDSRNVLLAHRSAHGC